MFSQADYASWVLAFVVGTAAGVLFTRAARRLAPRIGLLDAPDGRRKTQPKPVPVVGGAAVFLAAVVALVVVAFASPAATAALTADPRRALGLLLAAAVIVGVGLLDDRFNLRARYKFAGQAVAAGVLIYSAGSSSRRSACSGG